MARSRNIEFGTSGFKGIEELLLKFPERVRKAATLAVNDTADWARTQASREMRAQVNFPARYLDSKTEGRLSVSMRAKGDNLEARITGRRRPTSLARFTSNAQSVMAQMQRKGGRQKRAPLKVQVSPGRTRLMRSAFPFKLRAGKDTDTNFNLGIALRVPKGTAINKKSAIPVPGASSAKTDLYLLYAPSVDQVFQSVAADLQAPAARRAEDEFLRQFARLGE